MTQVQDDSAATEIAEDVLADAPAQAPADAPAFVDLPTLGEAGPSGELEDLTAYVGDDGPLGLEAVHEVPVKMQAVLGRARMTVSELMQIAPGRVVELDRKVGEPVDIFVSNRLIARGEVVLIDRALGVTLTEIVHEDD
ncbi:flagellar motor switch protein FliN [Alteriqipengyuania lutimaris]|uniref:Flagellar motor switch protein FliN n=1 Tax=Alteriqipengyuania lutimaris TaxID=1538146 RepID=A0A395LMX0_9SPHN|nr:flagellar motor switch protein FliN [Alteriqipengyuania lutimaris]MBB3032476.1 flagellar motor switch protein FliN/FliY [Alteriqipengyuania lutimaris]RDS78386.1 flagellar motor switch protein FliN [Alteriqipengyuania lutimaris]